MHTFPRARAVASSLSAALLCASLCASCLFKQEVGVDPVGPDQVLLALETSALTGDKLSSVTWEVLGLFDLRQRIEEEPLETIRALHRFAQEEPLPDVLFALSETCFWAGKRRRDPSCFLGAAVYAYLYLLPAADAEPPSPYDRRFRWACDLFDQGLLRAYTSKDGALFEPAEGRRELPVGSLDVRTDFGAFPWSDVANTTLVPADRFLLRGLAVRLRDHGLGVPLIAVERTPGSELAPERFAPVTAFLRLAGGLAGLEDGLGAALELYSAYDTEAIDVEGRRVPLETDRSAALAYALDRPEVWRFSLSAFLSGESSITANRLIQVEPYRPGRVPVVLVHGTASSPAYWGDLLNSVWRDPDVRRGAQFWVFRYASGNPIPYSAADLREALSDTVARLDPEGRDPALRNMVVIGHSQGGLLAKMMVVDGKLSWFEDITGAPVERMQLDSANLALLTRCLDYRPLPFVKRVVFVSTPHRGSFQATRWYSRIIDGLISVPGEIGGLTRSVLANEARLPKELRGNSFTSLENMDPSNPFLNRLLREPVVPGVAMNSIISIGSADPSDPEEVAAADDGVVEYTSAHLEGVESEALVPSDHSCQSHSVTIREVRRILREHLASDAKP